MIGQLSLRKRDRRQLFLPVHRGTTMWDHSEKAPVCKQGRESQQKPTLLVPWSWTFRLQTAIINFFSLRHPNSGMGSYHGSPRRIIQTVTWYFLRYRNENNLPTHPPSPPPHTQLKSFNGNNSGRLWRWTSNT